MVICPATSFLILVLAIGLSSKQIPLQTSLPSLLGRLSSNSYSINIEPDKSVCRGDHFEIILPGLKAFLALVRSSFGSPRLHG